MRAQHDGGTCTAVRSSEKADKTEFLAFQAAILGSRNKAAFLAL